MTSNEIATEKPKLTGTITQPCVRFCYSHEAIIKLATFLVRYTDPITKLHMAKPTCDKCMINFVGGLETLRIACEVVMIKRNGQDESNGKR
jgi:hypothetical protein